MQLSKDNLKLINNEMVSVPGSAIFDLPEKVLQFGTGVLLRGLPDFFIDKANRQGIFNGRIVVVKSTSQGDSTAFEQQDNLYTICVRGIADGKNAEENIINASISRVLNAQSEWKKILQCAHNPHLQVIISNTTEVGIQLVREDIKQDPPASFPGKLLALLYERFIAFAGNSSSGLVIVPTELIPGNADKLKNIVLELAAFNQLGLDFIHWLTKHNHFCNSLVDRIVPGRPDKITMAEIEAQLGYSDALTIMAEPYRLWAIEGNEQIKNILSFAGVDTGVVIESNIDKYRELKLRLLNGTHTLSCGLAFLAGFDTVKQAMEHEAVAAFIKDLMQQELAPAIPFAIPLSQARDFGEKVLDRFRNPHIKHQWISITMQYSSKMKMRTLPMLLKHYESCQQPPSLFSLGFAAYLQFMKPVKEMGGKYFGLLNGNEYPIQDDNAPVFYERWKNLSIPALVQDVLKDTAFWGQDLTLLPGLYELVVQNLNCISRYGINNTLASVRSSI